MTATSIFIRINVWLKFVIHFSTILFYVIINNPPATMMDTLREFLQTHSNNWSLLDHKQELSHLFYITMIAVILHLIDRQVEYILSLNIQWNEQLERDRIESETVGQINRMLLENILPPHVLKRYLYNTTVNYDQLYHESVSARELGIPLRTQMGQPLEGPLSLSLSASFLREFTQSPLGDS